MTIDKSGWNGWKWMKTFCQCSLLFNFSRTPHCRYSCCCSRLSTENIKFLSKYEEVWKRNMNLKLWKILICEEKKYRKPFNDQFPHLLVKLWITKNALRSWVSLVPGRSPSPCCCGFLWWSTASWRSPGNLHGYHLRAHPHFQLLHNPCTNCLPVQHPWLWGEDKLHLQRLQPPAALPQPCQPQRIGPSWPSLLLRLLQARQLRQWILPAGDFMGFISFQRQKFLPIRLWQVR